MTEFSLTTHIPEIPVTAENTHVFRTRSIAAELVAAGLLIGGATAAEANTPDHSYSVVNTNGDGAWLHADPGLEDEGDLIKIMPEGTAFDADCYVLDTPIGPNGNEIWLHGTDDTGATGYFTDHYSDSKWSNRTGNTLHSQGLPFCDELAAETESYTNSSGSVQTLDFNPRAAADWARDHAQDTPPEDSSCTNFISQALWAGGLTENEAWTDGGSGYGYLWQHRPGTPSAWAVEAFLEYVTEAYPHAYREEIDIQRFKENSLPEATLGSIILYDWEGNGEYDHAAIVTDIEPDDYPEVSEWSAYDGTTPTPYTTRGWTYSEKRGQWLEEENPNMTAHIINFDITAGKY